jgi:hypothetical protein
LAVISSHAKRVENQGNFALPGQTLVQAASLHLATSNWEEPDQRWDAVSNEVRLLKRQTFHEEVHGVLSQATADGLTSSWIHLSPSQSVARPKGRTTSTDESPWFCLNSVLAEANASAISLLRRA